MGLLKCLTTNFKVFSSNKEIRLGCKSELFLQSVTYVGGGLNPHIFKKNYSI